MPESFDGPAAPQQGMLGALIVWWLASIWLQWTMGTVLTGNSAQFPTKPTEEWKNGKMYAIKQIKICAEYRDMLPRPRLDLSCTPGLRPIGLSPGSWQTSLGLGSMSRYSAQILICITLNQIHQFSYKLIGIGNVVYPIVAILFRPQWETRNLMPMSLVQSWIDISRVCRLWTPKQRIFLKNFLCYFNDVADNMNPAEITIWPTQSKTHQCCVYLKGYTRNYICISFTHELYQLPLAMMFAQPETKIALHNISGVK